jgi:hypothetical protein
MTGWKIHSRKPLGGSTLALAMLSGAVAAWADELPDLRANQQLLSERLNQLAQGQNPGTGYQFSVNQNSAMGAAVTGGSFPSSLLIPGTETSLKIYGRVSESMNYWMSGGNPNSSPQSNTVGANGQVQVAPLNNAGATKARSNGIFLMTPRASRFGVETRTPTPLGEARTVTEFDWVGTTTFAPGGTNPVSVSNNLVPRLRYAYGTLGGFLAGQATSNFSDPDANAETIDFGGNVCEPGHLRIPQLRYTIPAWRGSSVSVSAESPDTEIGTPAGIEGSDAGVIPTATTSCTITALGAATTCTTTLLTSGQLPVNIAKSVAPDFTAAWYLPQPWGHIDLSAVLRPGLEISDGKYFAKNYIGYGGHIGLDVKPGWFGWTKDDFTFHFTVGDGIGTYIASGPSYAVATNYGGTGLYGSFNGPTTAAAAALIRAKTTGEFGTEIGYQHWWLDNLRSNINWGMEHQQIPAALIGASQAGAQNKEVYTAHVNLIWNPTSFIDTGLEYMWGQRIVVNNVKGEENVLISFFRVAF